MQIVPHDIDEIKLWQQFLDGDQDSLEKIYLLYFDELFNYGNRWLKNKVLTEDSIQDLFIKLLSNRSGLSGTESVKYYLFRAFRNVVLDKIKQGNRMPATDSFNENLFSLELSPENKLISKEDYEQLKNKLGDALSTLTNRQKEAVFLKYVEGFSYPQVAEMLELTPKATYKLMARAMVALKNQMNISLLFLLLKYSV